MVLLAIYGFGLTPWHNFNVTGLKPISLVSTVLNDRAGCVSFLNQMLSQNRRPSEIVIVDGGSMDGTWECLQDAMRISPIPLRALQENGCNIARGRNLAIAAASHELIVSTDIGCRWSPEWIEELAAPMDKNPGIEAVMGSWAIYKDDIKGWARVELAWASGSEFIATPQSHASSRSIAFRKVLWQRMGGYPQDLTLAGDDMVFALLLHKFSRKIAAAPVPRVFWERHLTLRAYRKEARRNFYGAGEAGIWIKYGMLVGGRLLFELAGPLLGLALLVRGRTFAGSALLLAAALSLLARVSRLVSASVKARELGVPWPIGSVILFDFVTRWDGVRGYWLGFLRGFRGCGSCRRRLDGHGNAVSLHN